MFSQLPPTRLVTSPVHPWSTAEAHTVQIHLFPCTKNIFFSHIWLLGCTLCIAGTCVRRLNILTPEGESLPRPQDHACLQLLVSAATQVCGGSEGLHHAWSCRCTRRETLPGCVSPRRERYPRGWPTRTQRLPTQTEPTVDLVMTSLIRHVPAQTERQTGPQHIWSSAHICTTTSDLSCLTAHRTASAIGISSQTGA